MEMPYKLRRNHSRLSTVGWAASAMVSVLVVSLIGIATIDACSSMREHLILPSAGACLEFWISRYQTLISALTALGAAVYASRLVATQLKEMRAQRAIQAYDAAKRELVQIQREGRLLDKLRLTALYMQMIVDAEQKGDLATHFDAKIRIDDVQKVIEDRRELISEIDSFIAESLIDEQERSIIRNCISRALDTNLKGFKLGYPSIHLDGASPDSLPREIQQEIAGMLRELDLALQSEREAYSSWQTSNWTREYYAKNFALRIRTATFSNAFD